MDPDRVCEAMMHDKKADSGEITIVETDRIGTFRMRRAGAADLRKKVETVVRRQAVHGGSV
jgi:3-dehydroquinate synthetase